MFHLLYIKLMNIIFINNIHNNVNFSRNGLHTILSTLKSNQN